MYSMKHSYLGSTAELYFSGPLSNIFNKILQFSGKFYTVVVEFIPNYL